MNIDSSYFTNGRRQILNATNGEGVVNPNNRAVNALIKGFIDQYTPTFLAKVIGREMAERLLKDNGDDEHMKALFDKLKEPMADFVMFYFLRYTSEQPTATGTVSVKGGNQHVSPARLQADIWNEMVNGLRTFIEYYPEYRVDQCLLSKITCCWI